MNKDSGTMGFSTLASTMTNAIAQTRLARRRLQTNGELHGFNNEVWKEKPRSKVEMQQRRRIEPR